MKEAALLGDPSRVLIWDLDGTIADTREDIAAGVAGLFRERGLTPPETAEVIRHVGNGVRRLVLRCLESAGRPARDDSDLDQAVAAFREHYRRHLTDSTVPYPGVAETLRALHERGRPMAVVSNKPEDFTREILRRLGLLSCFNAVLGGDSLPSRKPDPEPMRHALRLCDPAAAAEQTVVIGDSAVDAQAARAAVMLICGVGWGFDPDGKLRESGLDWWIETPGELAAALLPH
jgi:phosphoglycolate phosphatase